MPSFWQMPLPPLFTVSKIALDPFEKVWKGNLKREKENTFITRSEGSKDKGINISYNDKNNTITVDALPKYEALTFFRVSCLDKSTLILEKTKEGYVVVLESEEKPSEDFLRSMIEELMPNVPAQQYVLKVQGETKGVVAEKGKVYTDVDLRNATTKSGSYDVGKATPAYEIESGKLKQVKTPRPETEERKTQGKGDKENNGKPEKSEKPTGEKPKGETKPNGKTATANQPKPNAPETRPQQGAGSKPRPQTNGQQTGTQTQASKPSKPQPQKHWVVDVPAQPAWSETVVVKDAWTETVVDQPAWTEKVVDVPSYDITYCNQCGASFTGGNQLNDLMDHLDAIHDGGGYHTDTIPEQFHYVDHPAITHTVQHPAETQVIQHPAVPEQGHWE